MSNVFQHVKNLGPFALAGGGILAAGGISGIASYKANEGDPDQTKKAASAMGSGLIYGSLGAAALLATGYHTASKIGPASVKNFMERPLSLPKIINSDTPLTTAGLTKFAKSSKGIALGIGGVGALIGSQVDSDNPMRGAAIGAVGGAALGAIGATAMKGASKWSKLSPLTKGGLKAGGIIGGAVVLATAGQILAKPHEYKSEDLAERDEYSGGPEPMPMRTSGVKSRLNTMNASGDIVFGLNHRR